VPDHPAIHTTSTTGDDVLAALAGVGLVLDGFGDQLDIAKRRAKQLRDGRAEGASYSTLLAESDGPLVLEVLSRLLDAIGDAGSRLRRAEVNALYDEGLSMDKISRLLRVSRQRVSTLLRPVIGGVSSADPVDRERTRGLTVTDPEFRMIAEALPHIVWVSGAEGFTEYFNLRGREYTGTSLHPEPGRNRLDLVHPDDQEKALTAWENALRTNEAYEVDLRYRRFDGEYRWHSFRGVPLRAHDGEVAKWFGTATDIDASRVLEDELRQSERLASQRLDLLDTLQANAPVGFAMVDQEFRVLRINQRLAAINGAPAPEQIGHTVAELVPEMWRDVEPAYRQVLAGRTPIVNLDITGMSAEESSRPHRWLASVFPMQLDAGALAIGLVVVDVTDVDARGHVADLPAKG
jgi:PAS domain S-box-containing protein